MKNLFFANPFLKYSEKSLFIFGTLMAVVGVFLAYFTNVRFDGLIDVHQFDRQSIWGATQENAINILVICVLLFVFGKLINPKTRLIDVINAVLVFRIPFYVICLLVKIPFMESFAKKVENSNQKIESLNLNPLEIIPVMIVAMLFLVLLSYAIWLLFNGFRTATNCKKPVHYLVFGLLIIIAEVVTKTIIYNL